MQTVGMNKVYTVIWVVKYEEIEQGLTAVNVQVTGPSTQSEAKLIESKDINSR